VSLLQRGTVKNPPIEDELVWFFWPGCITHRGEALGVHGDASGGLHRRWNLQPELGFWYCRESEGERREKSAVLGFPWRRRASYSHPGSAAFISSVGKAAVDRVSAGAPPRCFCLKEDDDRNGIRTGLWGCGVGPAWWATAAGLRPGRFPLLFFYFFLFYFQFQLSNLNSNLLEGFWIWAT
jgi:hypothetical protein